MQPKLNRRGFLRSSLTAALAAGVFPAIVPASALGRPGRPAPSGRITVAGIGVGPQGRAVLEGFLRQADAQVIAVCDVKQDNLARARDAVNRHYGNADCKTYTDFRELLARPDLDAVLIATPDHWHCHVGVAAARAGKDMYLEKPMGLSLAEDQILRKAVQRHRCVFQFGTQQRSSTEFQKAVSLVRTGRIGRLTRINVWCAASRPGGSTAPIPPPPDMDYDFWLGPARVTPYTLGKSADENGAWKTWWFNSDYALGFIAGWGVHPLDIALWGHPAMIGGPIQLEGRAIFPGEGACDTAIAWEVNFRFHDGVQLNFRGTRNGYDQINEMNDLTPFEARYGKLADHGTAFEGTEGWVLVHRGSLRTQPEALIELPPDPELFARRSTNHVRNFLDCVKSRERTVCPVEEAVQADLLCQLSDIATRLERKLTFDPVKEKFLKDNEANRRLALRPMRSPWRLT
jgi:predicted dehydrogenase